MFRLFQHFLQIFLKGKYVETDFFLNKMSQFQQIGIFSENEFHQEIPNQHFDYVFCTISRYTMILP